MFKCLIPFRTTLGCSSVFLLSFPTLRIGKGLNFVLNEPSFQMLYSLKNFKDLHMFFKELACFILFSYQCSSAVLICFVPALSKKALETQHCFSFLLLPCSATLDNIPFMSKKVNTIFKFFPKKAL